MPKFYRSLYTHKRSLQQFIFTLNMPGGSKKRRQKSEDKIDQPAQQTEHRPKKRAKKSKDGHQVSPLQKFGKDNVLGEKDNLTAKTFVSWNVAGLRASVKKGSMDFLENSGIDYICLQEIKADVQDLPQDIAACVQYPFKYWLSSKTKGYAGVTTWAKDKPLSVINGLHDEELDEDGRVITLEYMDFYLVNAYVPNSGRKLVNMKKREHWTGAFHEFLVKLRKEKPVVLAGDLNVSHQEIDLSNPKTNTKNAGFTPYERQAMSDLLEAGFVDTYRELNPQGREYTFWSNMNSCRARDIGWRLDYFIVSSELVERVSHNKMRKDIMGSDHCPIILTMK